MKLRVESYSGHKSNQRPIKFWLGDRVYFVDSVEDQWFGPEAAVFSSICR